MSETERFAWLQLALTPYIGAETFLKLLQHFGSVEAALAAPSEFVGRAARNKQAAAVWDNREKRELARQSALEALEWETQADCRLMLLKDDDFPVMLAEGLTPPPLLFLRGNTALLHSPSVAIVGSRHATPQAVRIARDFGEALGKEGITVVSGMAAGIDAAAHQGALLADGGGTIAVWGTGINRIYPPSNKQLAYEIAGHGLIVSEFPLGTRPLAGNFPRRNRLIAALSCATLVVEAALESGSLITTKLAAEMGREVMAVPGSIDNPHSKGCHKLIKEGAKLVECLDDIVQECPQLLQNASISSYSINKQRKKAERPSANTLSAAKNEKLPLAEPEKNQTEAVRPSEKIQAAQSAQADSILAAMGYDPVHPDMLAAQTGLAAADIYAKLLEHELEGTVAALAGGRYQRIR
ncbi:DNA-protecting protein DprA [Neisseria animalis]|uniref:DNA-protecting protein DprA n=1 Tax=Neisseria animalis TaxID=492 RepID=A0A5P3MWE4_NEIAN|nr:DNA-processing protein DprA [Neisseria animalis]QEY24979.1 DNA-protecting protein DprA [Neisseria animalis]ROW31493.1 DNA-protecting protein DprA [Neisseria animalis]